jgi:hypothetical protein
MNPLRQELLAITNQGCIGSAPAERFVEQHTIETIE